MDLRTRSRVIEADYGRAFGWCIEIDGERVGSLTDPRHVDMFWYSYRLHSEDNGFHIDVFDRNVWYPECRFAFRNRYTGDIAPNAFCAPPPDDLARVRRITMRGLCLDVPSWLRAAHRTLIETLRRTKL